MILLKSLIENTNYEVVGNTEIEISGITYDSRKVKEKNIFVAIKGQHADGKNFVLDAIRNGASAIVTSEKVPIPENITQIIVPDTQLALGVLAAKYYQFPSKKLNIVGVTGTNGKTTITYLLDQIFNKAKILTAVIGTINYRFKDEILPAEVTTPMSSDLQALLAYALQKQFKNVVMEVSSHSLALHRVDEVEFDIGIFTNLTREHLDFHLTMENYFLAKLRLFELIELKKEKQTKKFAIINIDDNYGKRILECFNRKEMNYPVITYGLLNKNKCDFVANDLECSPNKTTFAIKFRNKNIKISTPLIGRHNVYNILAAFACAVEYGIDYETIKDGIEAAKSIPGRLEKVDCGQKFSVFIDYAHTDDALGNVLHTLRSLKPKKIVTVFGCGGDRDRSKRPLMGEVAATLSDYVILTSDNPRTEDPEKIILDIEVGIRRINKENYEIVVDREKAIERALQIAHSGDIVLIAGKGHEKYQIIGDRHIPFDDVEVVKKILLR